MFSKVSTCVTQFGRSTRIAACKLSNSNHFSCTATPIWLDCDTGHDDALAIILAAYNPNIDLIGISCTHGNQSIEKTTMNTLRMLTLINKNNIDVVKGAGKPLIVNAQFSPEIHGDSGLDLNDKSLQKQFEDLLVNMSDYNNINEDCNGTFQMYQKMKNYFEDIKKQKQKITICSTGCLTNIALMMSVFPEIFDKNNGFIDKIVFLGGSIESGNITPCAEWNVFIDPHSAHIVFNSFNSGMVPIIQIPIDCSRKVLVNSLIIDKIKTELNNSLFSKFIIQLLSFYGDKCFEKFGFKFVPLHDPLTIAYCIDSNIFQSEYFNVEIEINSELTRGKTIVDKFGITDKQKNVLVTTDINVGKFWDIQIDALKHANKYSLL
eukprot:436234_1